MTFWGVEIKPGKPYSHRLDEVRGRLHVSQATLGFGSSTKRSLVQCNVGNKSPVLLCSLLPDKTECSPLDLEFEEEDEVVFSVIGPRSVHLTGFYVGNHRDVGRRDDDTDSYGEDIAETETEESTDYDTEDEYEDDFIDDGDIEMFPPSPRPNSGVVIEELLDDEKPPNGHGNHKRLRKKYQPSDSDGDDNSQKQIVVKDTSAPELESEDEDGFPISFPNKPSETCTEAEAEEKSDKKTSKEGKKKKKGKDDNDGLTGFKRKVDTAVQDFEPERQGSDQLENSLMPSAGIGLENGERPKKKKKNRDKEGKALKAGINDMANIPKEEKTTEEEKNDNADQNIATKNEQDQKLTNDKAVDIDAEPVDENHSEEKKKRKKKKKKNKNQEVEAADANLEGSNLATEQKNGSTLEIDIQKGKPSQVRTFANGLVIEELSMGKPDGKRASPGNKVSVQYIGKLKKNGQIFDSNIGRAPFKFRLGVGEVVKGWDVGVNGMRIGDKRRLTIPPSMGYGSKGAGGKIPPNAWLVFDVELVDVR